VLYRCSGLGFLLCTKHRLEAQHKAVALRKPLSNDARRVGAERTCGDALAVAVRLDVRRTEGTVRELQCAERGALDPVTRQRRQAGRSR